MIVFIKIAFRNLLQHRTRSLILGGAIFFVTALLITITNLTSGVEEIMMKGSTTLFSGHLNITGFYKLNVTSAAPVVTKTKALRELANTHVPEATFIVDRINGFGKIISDLSSLQIPLMGIDVLEEKPILKDLKPIEGSIFELAKGNGIILFEAQAKKLKVKFGDMVTLSIPTFRNTYNTRDVKVIAILKDMGYLSNFSAFINKDDLREIYQMSKDATGRIMIFLPSAKMVGEIENRLRKVIPENNFLLMDKDPRPFWMKFEKVAAEGWTGQKIDITTWEDEVSIMKWIITLFNVLTIILTVVLLVIVVLGLMNMLWIAIKERTGEIGTIRAIGAQRRTVLFLFVVEPFMLSVISSCVGLAVGTLISLFLNLLKIKITNEALQAFLMSDTLHFSVNFENMIITFIAITLFTTLGAIIPAWKGSRMNPVTAMGAID